MRNFTDFEVLKGLVSKREANLRMNHSNDDFMNVKNSFVLTSSVKKSAAFMRRLKTGDIYSRLSSLKEEMEGLNLTKYVTEIANSIIESKITSVNNVIATAELISAINLKHPEFKGIIIPSLLKAAVAPVPPQSATHDREFYILRQGMYLKLMMELYLIGIYDTQGQCVIIEALKRLCFDNTCSKIETNSYKILPFFRCYGIFFTNNEEVESPIPGEILSDEVKDLLNILVPKEIKNAVREIMKIHHKNALELLTKECESVQGVVDSHYEFYAFIKEIPSEKRVQYQKIIDNFKVLFNSVKSLSKFLRFEIPNSLTEKINSLGLFESKTVEVKNNDTDDLEFEIWGNQETIDFYRKLAKLPKKLINDDVNKKDEGENTAQKSPTHKSSGKQVDPNVALDNIIRSLSKMSNSEDADSIALTIVKSNLSKKKLVKILTPQAARRSAVHLYARLLANLDQVIPGIGSAIMEPLLIRINSYMEKTDDYTTGSGINDSKYLSELVKFDLVPNSFIFNILSKLLDAFQSHHIDVFCAIIEGCGKYLCKSPKTSQSLIAILGKLTEKMKSHRVEPTQSVTLENAYFMCFQKSKPNTPCVTNSIEAYIKRLLLVDLSRDNVDWVLKKLKKLNWEDESVRSHMASFFSDISSVKFTDINLMAYMVYELMRYYPEFAIELIDELLENLKLGIEQNFFGYNQRRISAVRFLGELYNYKLLTNDTIFNTLYTILSLGRNGYLPKYKVQTSLDALNDFFRVRLSCALLETCGRYFIKGMARKKLEFFMCYLQLYILSKNEPPAEIVDIVDDIMTSLSTTHLKSDNYIQAADKLLEMIRSSPNHIPLSDKIVESLEHEILRVQKIQGYERAQQIDFSQESQLLISHSQYDYISEGKKYENFAAAPKGNQEYHTHQKKFKGQRLLFDKEPEKDDKKEPDLYKKTNKDIKKSILTNKIHANNSILYQFGQPLTSRVKTEIVTNAKNVPKESEDGVTFFILTKNKNKPQIHSISLPVNNRFVVESRSRISVEMEEKQKLKKLVLNYDERKGS